jgi:hypothetical protein
MRNQPPIGTLPDSDLELMEEIASFHKGEAYRASATVLRLIEEVRRLKRATEAQPGHSNQ